MLAGGVALFCKVFSFKISEEYNDTVMKIRKFVDLSVYYFLRQWQIQWWITVNL